MWGPKRSVCAPSSSFPSGWRRTRRPPSRIATTLERKRPGMPGDSSRTTSSTPILCSRGARRHGSLHATLRVIAEARARREAAARFWRRSRVGRHLDLMNGEVLDRARKPLKELAAAERPRVHFDRPIATHNYRTSVTVGARTVQDTLGYTGAGVGVAIIDSGITSWHDDLTNTTSKLFPYGNQRVAKFVDFVNGRTLPYDDNGHGSHVAGIIGGNGYDSFGEKTGIAPEGLADFAEGARRSSGQGTISNIIAALNWVAANATTYNIRVVNMSVGAGIRESVLDRPADARVQEADRQGHRRRHRRRQHRQERRGQAAVGRHHRAGQRAVGADRRRVEHERDADAQRRHDGGLQLRPVRPTSTTRRSRTWLRRASARSRWRCRAARSILDR